jgi:DNA-directed RNA polymerase subunit RPC12/RpoP
MQAHRCGVCGGDSLRWTSESDVVCGHCGSRYRKVPKAAPRVVIAKGANVVFGKSAKVIVKGGMEIQEGANVQIDGELEFELEVVELKNPEPTRG